MIDDIRPPQAAREPSLPPKPTVEHVAETKPQREPPAGTSNTPSEAPVSVLPFDMELGPAASPKNWRQRLKKFWRPTRKQTVLGLSLFVLLSGGAMTAAILLKPVPAKPVVSKTPVKPAAPPKPLVVPSALSGLPVDPAVNQRPVIGVMIENSEAARPQSGLKDASVVFEAIAEAGITRFLALYQDNQPANVGPVRSARPYFVQWAMGFDAAYAHVGGSPQALQNIKEWGTRDLDQFANSGAYHRISSRAAPHNMYSGIDGLTRLAQSKGYTQSTFTGFIRKAKEEPAKVPTAKSISLKISGPAYNVQYEYDGVTNSYKRIMAGSPHIDANSGSQLAPKVVIALVTPYGLAADGYHSTYQAIGNGQAYVFQDGTVTQGQWSKTSVNAQLVLTDASGQPLKLNAGQTWLTAVGTAGTVTYAP